MPLFTSGLNEALDGITSITHISLHTAQPNSSGSNEASGGSYARQSVTLAASSSGARTHGAVSFPVPAGTFTHVAYWTASTAGTCKGYAPLPASETFASAGTLNLAGGTLAAS